MKLVDKIKSAISERNTFNLSYDGVISGEFGDIIPICCKEVVPTDNFRVGSQAFFRLVPLATPTFGRIHCFINHFYVPYRILMPEYEFEDSMTGGTDGSAPETFPFITQRALAAIFDGLDAGDQKRFRKLLSYVGLGAIANNLGLASETYPDDAETAISLLPLLAIFRIYGDYYFPYGVENDAAVREVFHHKFSGLISSEGHVNEITILTLCIEALVACYTKDYFTTAFTKPERGKTQYAPIYSSSIASTGGEIVNPDNDNQPNVGGSGVSSLAIKWANSISAFLERNNVAGGRYFEQMLARFGVKLPDGVIQRSVYVGGKDFWVNISDVTATSDTTRASLGSQAGKGIALGSDTSSFSVTEYGIFISLLHFVPETGIVDGLERMWTRRTKFDFWQPELEKTGMQPVYNKEINSNLLLVSSGKPYNGVFGYVPRFAEYKFSNPILGGDFILSDSNSPYAGALLNSYHLYRRFSNTRVPVLNANFLRVNYYTGNDENNYDRIFQNTDAVFDHFFINTQISIQANRPMIGYAEGGLEFDKQSGKEVTIPYGGVRL